MQNFNEFLRENYEMTEEEFEALDSIYEKRIIEHEWDAYIVEITR